MTAKDAQGNTAIGYSGTVHISSSDAQASLSADATLTAGVGFFAAALRTAGNQTLTVTDTTNGSLSGTSAAITVSAGAASHFAVSAPAVAITGNAVSFTVTAKDPFNNTATGYTGTVHFTSSDAAATLPGNTTLTNGVGVFSATFNSLGSQNAHRHRRHHRHDHRHQQHHRHAGLTVTSLTPTPTGFVAIFDKPFIATVLDLYDSSPAAGSTTCC